MAIEFLWLGFWPPVCGLWYSLSKNSLSVELHSSNKNACNKTQTQTYEQMSRVFYRFLWTQCKFLQKTYLLGSKWLEYLIIWDVAVIAQFAEWSYRRRIARRSIRCIQQVRWQWRLSLSWQFRCARRFWLCPRSSMVFVLTARTFWCPLCWLNFCHWCQVWSRIWNLHEIFI